MAIKFSTIVKNARLNAIESAIPGPPVLRIRDGSLPNAITVADTGTALVSITLPADWMSAAVGGVIDYANGPWQDLQADAAGGAVYYRIYASDGTTPHIQGTVGASGSGADMELTTTSISLNQLVSITQFRLTEGN
jgi:hypothetical protein